MEPWDEGQGWTREAESRGWPLDLQSRQVSNQCRSHYASG
jgi:hypothetical protein